MLRKKEVYTNITPIPSHIPRQLAIDILHSHGEIITLNPLVLEHRPTQAPRDAAADEFYSTWYEITERIQFVPGVGKMGSGKITFKGCFHDMPWGLQTHILAPMNVDLRNNWRICGNQPGEPIQTPELGIGAPAEGLYLREDIEIRCNFTMVNFVKAELKAASKILVDRLIKKAELLDAGVLSAMMEGGKLKTFNPADRTAANVQRSQSLALSQNPLSPGFPPASPGLPYKGPYGYQVAPGAPGQYDPHAPYANAPPTVAMELPGDYYYPPGTNEPGYLQPPPASPFLNQSHRNSAMSDRAYSPDPNSARWSSQQSQHSSRPSSMTSDASGFRSPGLDQKSFAAELPAMAETGEEHGNPQQAAHQRKMQELQPSTAEKGHRQYNPRDYMNVS